MNFKEYCTQCMLMHGHRKKKFSGGKQVIFAQIFFYLGAVHKRRSQTNGGGMSSVNYLQTNGKGVIR